MTDLKEETEVVLPKLGESIHQALIVKWLVKEGQKVERDAPVVEVLTDKVASEIPAPKSGVLLKCLKAENEECQVGEPLFVLGQEKGMQAENAPPPFSPSVMRIAREQGVSMHELKEIKGSGENGRLTKKDLLAHLEENQEEETETIFDQIASPQDSFEIKLSPRRKETALAMQKSKRDIPAAYFITEADVTEIIEIIKETKSEGKKLTVTSFIIQAIAKAVEKYPHLNARLKGDVIEVFADVNLGIAVSVEDTIAVPVIEKSQELTLSQIAKRLTLLVEKARSGKLSGEEVGNGTITMTNFGMAKMQVGIPIIRPSEVAIIGVGVIERRLVVKPGDNVQIRSMMNLSLAFDHRVIDGMYAASFLNEIKKELESVQVDSKI